ncbi:hypothetical protein M2373_004132 [Chryseobacterium sp. JUb7]|nr:hypothetical protein [Chryseobacterium sp. JUb7]
MIDFQLYKFRIEVGLVLDWMEMKLKIVNFCTFD